MKITRNIQCNPEIITRPSTYSARSHSVVVWSLPDIDSIRTIIKATCYLLRFNIIMAVVVIQVVVLFGFGLSLGLAQRL